MKSKFDFTVYPNLPAPDGVWMPVYPRRSSVDTLGLAQIERLDPRGGTEYISVQNKQDKNGASLIVEMGTQLTYGLEDFYVVKAVVKTLPRQTYHQHPIMSVEITPAWIYLTLTATEKPKWVYDGFKEEFIELPPFPAYEYAGISLYRHGIVRTEAQKQHWHQGEPQF